MLATNIIQEVMDITKQKIMPASYVESSSI